MALTPWYKVTTLRKEVREGRSFSPDEFAIALEQVVAGDSTGGLQRSGSVFFAHLLHASVDGAYWDGVCVVFPAGQRIRHRFSL